MSIKDWQTYEKLPQSGEEKLLAVRKAYQALAHNLHLLSADDREEYLRVVATPSDSEAIRQAKLGMSGCALVAMGLWRFLGVAHELLFKQYRVGRAVADVIEIGEKELMLFNPQVYSKDHAPEVGDVVVIGFPEHVFTVIEDIEHLGNGHYKFRALHGGRKAPDGTQRIELAETWIDASKGYACTSRLEGGPVTNSRNVVHVIKSRFFDFSFHPQLPEDWA